MNFCGHTDQPDLIPNEVQDCKGNEALAGLFFCEFSMIDLALKILTTLVTFGLRKRDSSRERSAKEQAERPQVLVTGEILCPGDQDGYQLYVDIVNSGKAPVYIKRVYLGWFESPDDDSRFTQVDLTSEFDRSDPLPVGLDRRYISGVWTTESLNAGMINKYRYAIIVESPLGLLQKYEIAAFIFTPATLEAIPIANTRIWLSGENQLGKPSSLEAPDYGPPRLHREQREATSKKS